MTGAEFVTAVKAAGFTQKAFASAMGVHRTTIAELFIASEVAPLGYALAGLIAGNAAARWRRLSPKPTQPKGTSFKKSHVALACGGVGD